MQRYDHQESFLHSQLLSVADFLFLLKEVNGGEDWDLREFLREGGRKQTWDNVTRWVIGINHLERDIPWKELETITEEQRIEFLSRFSSKIHDQRSHLL